MFPGGIMYDKKIDDYRTIHVNVIIDPIRLFSNNSEQKESGQSRNFSELSASVPKAGIEPAHPKIHDLPAGRQVLSRATSTSSATGFTLVFLEILYLRLI